MLKPIAPLLLTALTLVPAALAQDQPEYMVAGDEHLQVLCWFYSERTGQALPEALFESAQGVRLAGPQLLGVPRPGELEPLQLFVYTTRKGTTGYVAGVESVSPGSAEGTVDFFHWPSRSAYVRMRPYPGDRALVELGVPADCLRRACVGVAQLSRQELAGGDDGAPRWFADGSAQYLATRALARRGKDGLGDRSIWLGTRVLEVRRMISAGTLPILEDVLADKVGDLGGPEVESLRAVLFEFLMEHLSDRQGEQGSWSDLRARLLRGLRGELLLSELDSWLGEGGVPGLEAQFHLWLQARRPSWDDANPALQLHSDGWAQASVKDNAIAWRGENVPKAPYRIHGEFRTFLDPRTRWGQSNLLFGRLGEEFLQVSIHTQTGISVWDSSWDSSTGERKFDMLQSKGWSTPFKLVEWTSFELRVLEEDAHVKIGNEELSPFSVLGRDMSGPWAVGTFKGSTTLWRNLTIESIAD